MDNFLISSIGRSFISGLTVGIKEIFPAFIASICCCSNIFDLSSWRDWDEDDKIQLSIKDGPVILKDMNEVKLLNTENASEDSVYNYALSLAGNEDRVFNHSDKVKVYTYATK